jgi:hypothetical protein
MLVICAHFKVLFCSLSSGFRVYNPGFRVDSLLSRVQVQNLGLDIGGRGWGDEQTME